MTKESENEPASLPPGYTSPTLEWIKVLLPALLSWPMVGLVIASLFRGPIGTVVDRFTQSQNGVAEIGPLRISLGTPALPPRYRDQSSPQNVEFIDLSFYVDPIGDTGPYSSTVGFAVMYAIRAAQASAGLDSPPLSPWGIYAIARKYDQFESEDEEGSSLVGALTGAQAVGVYSESDWPYASESAPPEPVKPLFKIQSFEPCNSIPQILDALRRGKVVAATIYVTDEFDNPAEEGSVIVKLPVQKVLLKSIAITGYDSTTAEFRFANDWGATWGDGGFGRLKDSDLAELLVDGYVLNL